MSSKEPVSIRFDNVVTTPVGEVSSDRIASNAAVTVCGVISIVSFAYAASGETTFVVTAAVIESAADAMVSSRKLRRDDDTISKQVEVTSCTSCDDEEAGCGCDLQTAAAEFVKTRC